MKRFWIGMVMVFAIPAIVCAQNKLTAREKQDGWQLLFNGRDMEGWTTTGGDPVSGGWQVAKGAIVASGAAHGGSIMTQGEFADFELSLEYKLEPGVNSGVKYFFTEYEKGGQLGMEYQLIDDKGGEDIHQADHLTGSFYDVLPPDESKKKVKAPGHWNTVRIVSHGNMVEHWLNGAKILSYTRNSPEYRAAVADSKFDKTEPFFGMVTKGHILLQEHGGIVAFRNIKIKTL